MGRNPLTGERVRIKRVLPKKRVAKGRIKIAAKKKSAKLRARRPHERHLSPIASLPAMESEYLLHHENAFQDEGSEGYGSGGDEGFAGYGSGPGGVGGGPGGGGGDTGDGNGDAGGNDGDARVHYGPGGPGHDFAPARPRKRGVPRKSAGAPGPGPSSARVECFFKAEMAGEILLKQSAPVDVTISRSLLEIAIGKIGGGAAAKVDKNEKLIMELGELHELRVDGQRTFEVAVPEPGKAVTRQFSVSGDRPADAQLIVHFRQGSSLSHPFN